LTFEEGSIDIAYAGFWRRVAAAMIDTGLFMVLLAIILGPAYINAAFFSLEGLVENGMSLVVTVFLWVKFLGTPGKLLMGCQVVDADSGAALSVRQAVLRYLGYYVSALPLGLGFFWIAWDKRKQGFHDKIANTVVLYNANIQAEDESQKSLQQLISEVR
jgi:uncharacterized RDD family membrane protein YckC